LDGAGPGAPQKRRGIASVHETSQAVWILVLQQDGRQDLGVAGRSRGREWRGASLWLPHGCLGQRDLQPGYRNLNQVVGHHRPKPWRNPLEARRVEPAAQGDPEGRH
jgi:hypothetical protein